MYLNVLSKKQKEIIKNLTSLNKKFYLAGGTGLALQLRHRTSVDFDFYSSARFEPEEILPYFRKTFNKLSVRRAIKDTLILTLEEIDLSFFYYPYMLLAPLKKIGSVNLASIKDIAAMKIAAIVQRGKQRDFIDIFYLLDKFSLKQIIRLALKKYPGYQEMLILRALIYFEDAKEEELGRKIKIFDKNFSWEKAKKKIFEEVRKYQLSILKK